MGNGHMGSPTPEQTNQESCGFWMAQYEDKFPAQVRVSGHLWTLIWNIGHLCLKVQWCPMLSRQFICIKYQDENNDILGVDTFGSVQNSSLSWKLVLKTEQFKSHGKFKLWIFEILLRLQAYRRHTVADPVAG